MKKLKWLHCAVLLAVALMLAGALLMTSIHVIPMSLDRIEKKANIAFPNEMGKQIGLTAAAGLILVGVVTAVITLIEWNRFAGGRYRSFLTVIALIISIAICVGTVFLMTMKTIGAGSNDGYAVVNVFMQWLPLGLTVLAGLLYNVFAFCVYKPYYRTKNKRSVK